MVTQASDKGLNCIWHKLHLGPLPQHPFQILNWHAGLMLVGAYILMGLIRVNRMVFCRILCLASE
ncbi:MAG: hypothetical protein EBT93_07060 [Alphaproteobacteria bacterium]|nr:hypothetical protein [Alphaproteobacteria bacterium]